MIKGVKIVRKLIFLGSLLFIAIAIFSLTIAQGLPYEFTSQGLSDSFYSAIFYGIPVSILCTLFYTVRAQSEIIVNVLIVVCTLIATYLSLVLMAGMMFSVGFIVWEEAPYRYRNIETNTIVHKQHMELGVFGSGGDRYIIQKPHLLFWNKVTEVDSSYVMTPQWITEPCAQ